jgi:hypothetical protein
MLQGRYDTSFENLVFHTASGLRLAPAPIVVPHYFARAWRSPMWRRASFSADITEASGDMIDSLDIFISVNLRLHRVPAKKYCFVPRPTGVAAWLPNHYVTNMADDSTTSPIALPLERSLHLGNFIRAIFYGESSSKFSSHIIPLTHPIGG